MKKEENKYTVLILILITLANIIMKSFFASANDLAGDEPYSVYYSQFSISSIIEILTSGNNPPLYEILLHFWVKLFGISELAVRIPSVLFSSLTVVFIFIIGQNFFSRRVGIVASLLFTFSNYFMLYAHEARVYSLFAFLTASSMCMFLYLINGNENKKVLVGYIISNVFLLYAHYFGFFVIAIQICFSFILFFQNKKVFKKLLLIQLIVFVFYLPLFPILIERFLISSHEGTWLSPPNGLFGVLDMLRNFNNEAYGHATVFGSKPLVTLFYIGVVFIATIKMIISRGFKINAIDNNYLYIICSFILPFAFMFLISFKIPMFLDRYMIFTVIAYIVSLAICIDYIFSTTVYSIAFSIVCLLGMVLTFTPNIDNKRQVKETINKIVELKDSNTAVLICPDYFVLSFIYYYNQELFKIVDSTEGTSKIAQMLNHDHVFMVRNRSELPKIDQDKIIYLDAAADFAYPNNEVYSTLEQNYILQNKHSFYEIFNVNEFSRKK